MAIVNKDGFDFYDDLDGNPEAFIVKGVNFIEEKKYLLKNKIKSITISKFESDAIINLDFLKEVDFIEKISIDNTNVDCTGLYYLNNLKYIIITVKNKKQFIEYSRFKHLEYLSIDWYSKFPDLSKNNKLKELIIWKFKPKSKSFSELKIPKSLERFEITESNVKSLQDLDLPNLKKFEGHYCNEMGNFEGIENNSQYLEVLILSFCKKLNNYDLLKKCLSLEKLILGNCGEIQTLKWLNNLKNIRHFSFWNTKLADGDTSPCFGIDYVSFKNEKHYNHKMEEFNN